MATVTLTTARINLASDPSQHVVLTYASAIQPKPVNPQTDRLYGGGRFRAVNAGAIQRVIALAAKALTPTDAQRLEAWNGQLVWYRDDSGQKWAATYADLTITRHPYDENVDATLTITEKTATEGV